MFRSYRVGTAFGFPIEINISFLLVLGLALLFLGGLQGVLAILILFTSVLLHELGHALVARHFGRQDRRYRAPSIRWRGQDDQLAQNRQR